MVKYGQMKRLLLVVTVVLVLASVVIGCSQTQTPTTQPYKSRYTADQVIYIAQAQYPACYRRQSGMDVQAPPSITVTYVGGSRAAWKVQITCPPYFYQLGQPLSGVTSKTLYFYETDGSLRDTYYP